MGMGGRWPAGAPLFRLPATRECHFRWGGGGPSPGEGHVVREGHVRRGGEGHVGRVPSFSKRKWHSGILSENCHSNLAGGGGGVGGGACADMMGGCWARPLLAIAGTTFGCWLAAHLERDLPHPVPCSPGSPAPQAGRQGHVGAPPRQGRRGEGPWCGESPRTAPPHPHFCSCSAGTQPPGRQRLRRWPAHGCRAIFADPGSRAAAPQPQGPETCVRLGSVAGRTCRNSVSSSCSNRSHLSTERHYFFKKAVFLLNKYKLCLRHPLFYVSMCFASGEGGSAACCKGTEYDAGKRSPDPRRALGTELGSAAVPEKPGRWP